jgi:hypothetical protein
MTLRKLLLAVAVLGAAVSWSGIGHAGLFSSDTLTDAQQVIADTKINAGAMTIEAGVDRPDKSYDAGQPIAVSVRVSKDAHVAILRVLANGSTVILFPNRKQPKSDIKANTVLTVPGPGDPVTIVVDKAGVVLLEFVASTNGESWLFKRAPSEGSDFADLGATTHALAKYITDSLKVNKGPETVATYLKIRID